MSRDGALAARLEANVVTGENREEKMQALTKQLADTEGEDPKQAKLPLAETETEREERESKEKSSDFAKERRRRKDAEARADRAEREARELRAQLLPPSNDNPAPKLEDYNGDAEKYADAKAEWKVKEQRRADEAAENHRRISERAAELREEYPDFDDTLKAGDGVKVNPGPLKALLDCGENIPDLQYYLLKHPEEFERINAFTELGAARAYGRILEKLDLERDREAPEVVEPTKPATLRSVSKAPTPITPIRSKGTEGINTVINDKGEVTDGRAYRDQRRAEIAARQARR
jgi:DNA repair exonuclease SbcCD ATPase subunit